jgi:hypothetical protein
MNKNTIATSDVGSPRGKSASQVLQRISELPQLEPDRPSATMMIAGYPIRAAKADFDKQSGFSETAVRTAPSKKASRAAQFPPTVSLRIPLERDSFLSSVACDVAGTLQDRFGPEEAAEFIGSVGRRLGDQINNDYKAALDLPKLNRGRVAEVLVDAARRINGDFYVIEQDEDKIVLGNWVCPFGKKVTGRTAMCMMTSNLFGTIAAENLDYARVALEKTIAEGASGCRVVVHLKESGDGKCSEGREYFKE